MTEEQQNRDDLRCIGCGAKIQTTDKNGIGYTPKSALERGLESGDLSYTQH